MIPYRTPAANLLLGAGTPPDFARLRDSHRELLTQIAQFGTTVPEGLADLAFATRDAGLLTALARNAQPAARSGLSARLAAEGGVPVAAAAVEDEINRAWYPSLPPPRLRPLFAALEPDDPEWAGHEGLLKILTEDHRVFIRRAAVACRVPGVAASVLRDVGPELTEAERLLALASIAEADGPAAVAEHLRDGERIEARDLAADAAEGVIAELREGLTDYLRLRATLDWDAIIAAHDEKPFRRNAVKELTERDDCPQKALKAFGEVAQVVRAGDLDWALDHARPARKALQALRGQDCERLRVLVREKLGADVDAWRAVRSMLKSFKGTVTELFEHVDTAAVHDGPWPEAEELPEPGKRLSLSLPRAAFLTLLDAAPVETHVTLLPHFDDRTVHDLLTQGVHRPEWTEHVLLHGTPTLLAVLADDKRAPRAAVQRLMRLGDPDVLTRLRLRHREWRPRDAIGCTDFPLRARIITKAGIHGEIPRLRMLLDAWEHHGAEVLPEMLKLEVERSGNAAFAKAIRERIEALLAEPDREAALRTLRAFVEAGETPEAQVALLRKASERNKLYAEEHHAWHWDALIAAHETEPFADHVLFQLTRHGGCPERLRELAAAAVPGLLAENPVSTSDPHWSCPRLLADGHLSWPTLIELGRPATDVLYMLADSGAFSDMNEGLRALSALVAGTLGSDPDAWQLALGMLDGFEGTVPELLRTAAAAVD